MRLLGVFLIHFLLRAVTALMMAAGLAALVSVAFVMRAASPEWAEWITPVRQAAIAIGVSFLSAAVIAVVVLPPRRELTRFGTHEHDAGTAGISIVLAVLAVVAAWQLPLLLAWWGDSERLVQQLTAGERDRLGLWIIPLVVITAPPFIATLIVSLFFVATLAFAIAPPPGRSRVLLACVLLPGGLVIGSSLTLPAIRSLASQGVALAVSAPDPETAAAMMNVVARQEFFATTLLSRFEWILGAYIIAAVVASYGQRGDSVDPRVVPASQVAANAAIPTASPLSRVFDSSAYRARLQTHWLLASLRLAALDYTITPLLTATKSGRFFFSGKDHTLRRATDGAALFKVNRQRSGSLLKSEYVVTDASSGDILGILEKAAADWNVLDAFRRPLARVEETETRQGYCRYRMHVDNTEVCRFTWALPGLGVWSAEMEIEFSADSGGTIHRVYAMALAPILEAQARRTSERMGSS
jgi:hypothetical protein